MDYLSLCLICKNENDYLPEWLDYHILMGVDRFYIYDNESQVSLRDSLKTYIDKGWVIVTDIPGFKVQLFAYDHCIQAFGKNTFWMGFIDTDEFLVPKSAPDIKTILKEYEGYGGLAVSSLFFGSNGNISRPQQGQISAYTLRTPEVFPFNMLVKVIVQPAYVELPLSPHEFALKDKKYTVNENSYRVDNQEFPCSIEKIQLNHYFCRSEAEIKLKLERGGGARHTAWPRLRFDKVNQFSSIQDTVILQNLEKYLKALLFDKSGTLSKDMSLLAESVTPSRLEDFSITAISFDSKITEIIEFEKQFDLIEASGDQESIRQWTLKKLQMVPSRAVSYCNLANRYIELNDIATAWQILARGWEIAPNSFAILLGMAYYFLSAQNFPMAEKTSRLVLEIAPQDLLSLGFLSESLMGQGKMEEGLRVGLPVIEHQAMMFGEIPVGMSLYLIGKMANYLEDIKDFQGAAHVWDLGIKIAPNEINILLGLSRVLMLAGDLTGAGRCLSQAQKAAPKNEAVLALSVQYQKRLTARGKPTRAVKK